MSGLFGGDGPWPDSEPAAVERTDCPRCDTLTLPEKGCPECHVGNEHGEDGLEELDEHSHREHGRGLSKLTPEDYWTLIENHNFGTVELVTHECCDEPPRVLVPAGSAACPVCCSVWLDPRHAASCCEDERACTVCTGDAHAAKDCPQ